MTKLRELEAYLDYEFSSCPFTSDDYLKFQSKYITYLKRLCKDNGLTLVKVNKNHYCFSAFVKSKRQKCAYISIGDVRYMRNGWYDRILVRIARDDNDYTGGTNKYTSLENLTTVLKTMLE